MGLNGSPNLQDIFNQRFGAGAYENGINQARQAGQNYYNAQVQAEAQKLFTQMQAAQDKIQKQQQAAQAKLQKPIDDQKNAADYWNQNKDTLLQKGAYRTVQDLQNDPELQAQLKAKGYDIKALADQAYNVATGGQIKSASGFKDFYNSVNPDSETRKQNQSGIQDVIDQDAAKAAQAKQDAINKANYDNSWYGKLLNGIGSKLDDAGNVINSTVGDIGNNIKNEYNKVVSDPQGIGHGLYGAGNDFFNSLSELGNRFDNQATGTLLGQGAVDKEHQQQQNLLNQLKLNPTTSALAQSNQNIFNQSNSQAKSGLDQLANLSGGFAGNVAPYLVGDGLLGAASKIGKVGELGNLVSNPLTQKVAGGALSGAVGGGLVSGAKAVGGDNQNANDVMKNILDNAAFGAGGEFLLNGGLKSIINNLNLKGQAAKLMQDTGSVKFNPDTFQQALQDAHAPSGNFSNVLADTPKQIPQPFEQKYNLLQQTKVTPTVDPTVQPGSNTNNWFGNTVQPIEHVPQPNVPNQPIIPHALADDAFTKATLQANAPAEGFNQRLLDVQKEMKGLQNNAQSIANQHGGSYTPNVDSLYQQVRKANDPNTFDDLVKNAEMEHNVANPDLKTALHLDPRIKQQLDALNALGKPGKQMSKLVPEIAPKNKGLTIPELKGAQQQSPYDVLKALQTDRNIKPGGSGGNGLLLSLTPKKLDSIKTTKAIETMSKGELQDVMAKLEKQESLVSKGGKGSEAQLKKIQSDKQKVSDLLMKLDLQQHAANPFEAVKERIMGKAPEKTPQDIAREHTQVNSAVKKLEEKGAPVSEKAIKELQKTKDISPGSTLTKNIYELADRLPKEIGDKIKAALDKAKSNHVDNLEQRSNDLYNKMVKELGINKGSKESALVQDFGEKTLAKDYLKKQEIDPETLSKEELDKINLQQLQEKRPNDWQKFVEADKYFKGNYKKMIDEVNTTVKRIYPNNPDKIVPERQDYYHHFNELEGFEGFKNLIQNSAAIDPHLAGISPNTKPNSKWQSFKQMRGNGEYKSDAVGGYLKYLQAASHSTHIDPMIKVLRQAADQIATATEGTKNLNNLKSALEVHADNLAGKTNPIDRLFQDHIIGRKAMQFVNLVNGHIKKNMVLGNLGSAIGQIGNVPLTLGKAKQFAPKGLMDTLKYTASHLLGGGEKNLPINQSQFLKERFSGEYFKRFDNGLLKKPEKMAAWMLETADKSGTYFTWNSMYRKGVSLSEKAVKDGKPAINPIKYADEQTRHIVAGRGVGEVPIAQRAKVTQLVAPFSLEVGNAWKVLGKQMKEKDFAGVITFLAASYGLNTVMNKIKGNDVSFNPVGAVINGYSKTDGTTTDKLKAAGANLLGETVGNIPGGNYIPQIVGLKSQATKQALFGNNSPDRFGTGLGVASTIFKPATDFIGGNGSQALKDSLAIALPFGGNQAKKTWSGIEALSKGGSYDSKGNLQYPVDSNNVSDLLHALLMGPTTTNDGQNYYNNNGRALSSKQTAQFENAPNKQDYYNNLLQQRKIKAAIQKMKDMKKQQILQK